MGVVGGIYVTTFENGDTVLVYTDNSSHNEIKKRLTWKTIVDCCSGFMIFIIFGMYSLRYLGIQDRFIGDYLWSNGHYLFNFIFTSMTIGLCLDGTRSVTSKFLNTKILRTIGNSSFQLYLLQFPILAYMKIAESHRAMSGSLVTPFCILLPLLVAPVVRIFYDEPFQRFLS